MGTKTGFVAGAVFALVVGSGTAYAATGGTFILGKFNGASTTTTLVNGKGTALTLKSRAGTPALRVGNSVKVPNLNADKFDGKDSAAFALTAGGTGYVGAAGFWQDADEDGVNDSIVAIATCPVGSKLTGGGSSDWTVAGVPVTSSPYRASWVAVVMADPAKDRAVDVESYAVCYNPRGAVRGATPARRVTADGEAAAVERARTQVLRKMGD